jgi:hypothetical protein
MALSSDGQYHGQLATAQTLNGTVTAGDVVYLNSSGTWQRADKTSETACKSKLGISLGSSGGGTVNILIKGWVRYTAYTHMTAVGSPVFVGTAGSTGGQTQTATTTTGQFIRCIGHCWSATSDILIFDPDNTWAEVA